VQVIREFGHILRRPPERHGTINFVHIPKNAGTELKARLCGRQSRDSTSSIVYNGHSADVRGLANQLIVLRDPVKRFASAVRYALQEWGHGVHLRALADMGLDSADSWVEVWRAGPSHPQYGALMLEIHNDESGGDWIGTRTLERRYIYTAQSEWVHNPRWVLLAETLEEDMEFFCRRIGLEYVARSEQLNHTTRTGSSEVSPSSAEWLRGVYQADVQLYETYTRLSREERIPCSCPAHGILERHET